MSITARLVKLGKIIKKKINLVGEGEDPPAHAGSLSKALSLLKARLAPHTLRFPRKPTTTEQ